MKKSPYIFMAFIVLLSAGNLAAQWKLTASNVIIPTFRPYNGGGIITHHNGILWAGYRDVWMSADTGKTWSLRTPFNGFNNSSINDIFFYDDNIGLATTQNGELYITQDQGMTWVQHIPMNPYHFHASILSGAFLGTPDNIIACSYAGELYISNDRGSTWQLKIIDTLSSKIIPGTGGTAYVNGGSIQGQALNGWLYETNDFGATWRKHSGIFNLDSYSFDRDRCDTSLFYFANDGIVSRTDPFSHAIVSTNTGESWTEYDAVMRPYRCGSVAAAQNSVYMQTFKGVIRSTDHGQTWKDIGGPPNTTDTRFLTAIDNNIIVAVDSFGSIWVTTNSGGDSLAIMDGSKISIQTKDQKTDTLGGTVAVPISVGGLTSQQDLDIILHYDPQLIYRGTYPVGNTNLDITNESSIGRSRIQLRGANSSGILAYSYFDVYSDSSKKPVVTFDSLIVLTAIVPCNNTLIFNTTSVITPVSGCGVDILSRFMRHGLVPELSINPNPTNGDISITSSHDLGEVNVFIYDMLGEKKSESILNLAKNTPAKIMLPLINGVYSVRVKSGIMTYNLRVVFNR